MGSIRKFFSILVEESVVKAIIVTLIVAALWVGLEEVIRLFSANQTPFDWKGTRNDAFYFFLGYWLALD